MMDGVKVVFSKGEVSSASRRTTADHNRSHESCQEIVMEGVCADQFVNDNVGRFVSDLSLNAKRILRDELEAAGLQ